MKYRIKRFSKNEDEENLPSDLMNPLPLDLGVLRRYLQDEGYSDRELEIILDQTNRLTPEDKEELQNFLDTGEISKEVKSRMKHYHHPFITAFMEEKGEVHRKSFSIFKQLNKYEEKMKNLQEIRREYHDPKTSKSRKKEIENEFGLNRSAELKEHF